MEIVLNIIAKFLNNQTQVLGICYTSHQSNLTIIFSFMFEYELSPKYSITDAINVDIVSICVV
jgi:hypothetical protein